MTTIHSRTNMLVISIFIMAITAPNALAYSTTESGFQLELDPIQQKPQTPASLEEGNYKMDLMIDPTTSALQVSDSAQNISLNLYTTGVGGRYLENGLILNLIPSQAFISYLNGITPNDPSIFLHYIELVTGWNLISTYVQSENTNIESVLSPVISNTNIIWAYDASDTADHWKKYDPNTPFGNDLITMEPGKGYWIMIISDDTLPNSGTMPEPTDIELWSGWNLIGYNSLNPEIITDALSSINGNYSIIWAYNASDSTDHWKKYDPYTPFGNDLENMEPGCGYWIMMNSNDTLIN